MSDATTTFQPAARLSGLKPYLAPVRATDIDLLLDLNEGDASRALIERWLGELDPASFCRYPNAGPLEQQIAESFDVPADRVVVTSGGDDAIDRICRATLEPGRTLLTHTPSFEMTTRSARLAGAAVRELDWWRGPFPLDRFGDALSSGVGLVALTTPNNPTGGVIDPEQLLGFVRSVPCPVLVDLAYIEFADHDPTAALLAEPNAIVVRTFSKAMGLASARVGYAIASPTIATWLRTVGGPFPVAGPSLTLASLAWQHRDDLLPAIHDSVRAGRAALMHAIEQIGGEPIESEANFMMARFDRAEAIAASLAERGIAIRCFTKPALAGWLRITVPISTSDQSRLVDTIKELSP